MRAVIYCRISDDRTGEGLGVQRQEADCRALCEREGYEPADILVDNDLSAYRGKKRPGFDRLREGLKAKEWQVVVAWHPDRLTRHPKELEGLIDLLEQSGVGVQTVMAGVWDLSTASGRMVARQLGAVARYESEVKSERIRRKHRELAENGEPSGGSVPFGWMPDRVHLHPKQAAIVREMAQRVLDGATLRSVKADLDRRGVVTSNGLPWSLTSIRRILVSPRVAGYRRHGGKLHRAKWDPILDDVTWKRLCALLLDPGRRAALAPRRYLLTGGIAVCGRCGAALVARPKGNADNHRRAYTCAAPPGFKGCGKLGILADDFEDDVCNRVAAAIDAGRIPEPEDTDTTALLAELEQVDASMAELTDDYYVQRTVTKEQFQHASASLDRRRDALRAQLGSLSRQVVDIDRAVLDDRTPETVERRRLTIARCVEAVVVGPAVKGRNFYSPDRVNIRWKV